MVGGTVRQLVWLGVLLAVPSTLWLLRKRRGLFWSGVLFWLAGVIGIVACLRWFYQQPYFVFNSLPPHSLTLISLKHLVKGEVKAFLCLMLLVFPVLALWLPLVRSVPRRPLLWLSGILSVLLTGFLLYCNSRHEMFSAIAPWLANVIVQMGVAEPDGAPGPFHNWQRIVITVLVLGSALVFFLHLFSRLRTRAHLNRTQMISWREMLYLLLPYTLGYIGAVSMRGVSDAMFDRYLLIPQTVAIILLLRYYQDFAAPDTEQRRSAFTINRLPVVSQLALLAFAYYAIAGTHDWFAMSRAHLEAAEKVRRSGVPRTAIQGGFEYDGWTQLEAGGHINHPDIRIPRNAFHPAPQGLPPECDNQWFPAILTPAIVPQYFIVPTPLRCFATSSFSSVTYQAWMPPFTRRIYVRQRKDLTKSTVIQHSAKDL